MPARRNIYLVVRQKPAPQSPDCAVNVHVGVQNSDQTRPEHQDGQCHRIRRHAVPVEHAHRYVFLVRRFAELEQRRAAQHRRRNPRERHPALAPGTRLHREVPHRFANRYVPVTRLRSIRDVGVNWRPHLRELCVGLV